jgi:hypothetical protein
MYSRSRPWRSRGPSFGSRAGARRRGHRSDKLTTGCVVLQDDYLLVGDVDITAGDAPQTEHADDAPIAASLAAPPLHAARIDETGLHAFARSAPEQAQSGAGAAIGNWPLELLTSERSDLMLVPPRRSA